MNKQVLSQEEKLRERIKELRSISTGFGLYFTRSGGNTYQIDIPIDLITDLLNNIDDYLADRGGL